MENELVNHVSNESDTADVNALKKWNAPQMTVVSIAGLTEGLAGAAAELNTTTKS